MTTTPKPKKKIFDRHYELVSLLGRGKKSAVYHALFDSIPGEDVALKVLLPNKELKSLNERLRNEAQAMLMAQHQFVLKLNDFQHYSDLSYLSLEYAPHGDLRKYTKTKPDGILPPNQAQHFFKQLVEALHFCHSVGVLHRDIKPENILVVNDNEIRLADFGLAKLIENPGLALDLQKAVGTMDYLAPEVLEGKDYGTKSDFYSLAITFYEILTGKHPFADLPLAEVLNSRNRSLINIKDLVPGINQMFASILMQLLENDPNKRFSHSKELIDKLVLINDEPSVQPENADLEDDFIEDETDLEDFDTEEESENVVNDLDEIDASDDSSLEPLQPESSNKSSNKNFFVDEDLQEEEDIISEEESLETEIDELDDIEPEEVTPNPETEEDGSKSYQRYPLQEKPAEKIVSKTIGTQNSTPKIKNDFENIEQKTADLSPKTVNSIRNSIFAGIDQSDEPQRRPSSPSESSTERKSYPSNSQQQNTAKKLNPSELESAEIEEPNLSPIFTYNASPNLEDKEILPVKRSKSKFILYFIFGIILSLIVLKLDLLKLFLPGKTSSNKTEQFIPESKTKNEIPSISKASFANLSNGIYSGVITGLLPNSDQIRFGIIVKEKTTAIVLGIHGWVPSPAIRATEDSLETASNSWILRFVQNSDSDLMEGKISNLVTGDSGSWKIDSFKE